MLRSDSTILSNRLPALVPALGAHPIFMRCRSKSIEKASSVKSSQKRIFREVRQELGGSHQTSSFVHVARAGEQIIVTEVEASQKSEKTMLKVFPGQAHPLGVSEVESGTNFAIFSQNATAVTICLVLQQRGIQNVHDQEMIDLSLDPQVNKTGDIWHICVEDLPRNNVLYGYRVNGPQDWYQGHRFDYGNILLDPYAKLIEGRRVFGDASNKMSKFFGTYDFDCSPFDWGPNYKLPNIHEKDLVIYEMNVRALTADESSGLEPNIRGSYLGVIEKIPHLVELGVNAVELLPVFEFDEMEFQRRPNPRNHMINTWGYSTINFFAPMSRYASNGGGPSNASREFKEMVKALHDAGIEVILDVVYNHTNEADDENPYTTSFRGIDNKVYYMVDLNNNAQLLNFSGCDSEMAESSGADSYDPSKDPKRKAKSKDPGWKYGFWPDLSDKNVVQCILCGRKINGGIKRFKQHLTGGYGDVAKCSKTSTEIANEMHQALMSNKRNKPIQFDDNDELEEIQSSNIPSIASNPSNASSATVKMMKSAFQFTKPQSQAKTIETHIRKSPEEVVDERHRKGPNQTTLENRLRSPEEKEKVHMHIANWFYENGIPFNTVNSRSFEVMIESIGQYGPGLKPPSYHELRVPLLAKAKTKTEELKEKHKTSWKQYGCTLMSDGWTDRRGRHLINFHVNSPAGTYFMGSVDASSQSQDASMLTELLDGKIKEIGAEYVVQVVTDNASNYKAAGQILMERRPTLFWTPCAAHCLDLMLEDIGNLKQFKPTIWRARRITIFIYRHGRLLDAMRTKTDGRDLVRSGVTRFATSFLTLQSLCKHKDSLRQLFISDDWTPSKLSTTEAGKKVYDTVISSSFWHSVEDCIRASQPLLVVLRIVDSDERPAMPEILAAMEFAKKKIKDAFNNKQRLYKKVMGIIKRRWECQMEQKLYGAALFLNPGKYFDIKEDEESGLAYKLRSNFNDVLSKMVPDQVLADKISDLADAYESSRGDFSKDMSIRQRKTKNPSNTLNCNHPVVTEFILDSLRHWVIEYHVDGFRFDLASVLCRGADGSPLNAPPLIKAIAKDSILSRCKIIAEPWDCGGLYLVGKFPNWDRWAEWNGIYRDDIRRFVKGENVMKGSFATRIAGSADLYRVNKRKPCHGINFIIAHDGFTLYDLVSYNFKHNDANGEGGNDGSNDNLSWNCGFEGETEDTCINALRMRQMKNFHVALMISQGTPMMLMGDEYGHTRYGNNNSYGHDNALNHFQWGQLKNKKKNLFRFFSEMIKFRRSHHVFTREDFISKNEVTWHEDNWENYESRFLAFTLHEENGGDLYVAFNAHDYFVEAVIPSPPQRRQWFRVVDTNLESPNDFVLEGDPGVGDIYNIAPHSSIILEAKP